MGRVQIPQLTTERLLLRDFRPEDFDAYAGMMAAPEVGRFLMDGRPLSRVEAWRQMAMFIGHWDLRGYGLWAVEERETGRFIGRIGCLEPEGFPAFEIAYTLTPSAWGHGYAREGAAAALRLRARSARPYADRQHHPARQPRIDPGRAVAGRHRRRSRGVLRRVVHRILVHPPDDAHA